MGLLKAQGSGQSRIIFEWVGDFLFSIFSLGDYARLQLLDVHICFASGQDLT